MKTLIKVLTYLLVLFFVACSGIIVYFDDYITCGEDNEMVEFARSLSQERLSDLYNAMEEYSNKNGASNGDYLLYKEEITSAESFQDIPASRIWPNRGQLELRKCFDHGIFLSFKGVGRFKDHYKEKQIELSWGEHDNAGTQILWPK